MPQSTAASVGHCIGRFVVDLPDSFRPEIALSEGPGDLTLYFGRDEHFRKVEVNAARQAVDPAAFVTAVDSRAAAIAAIAAKTNYVSDRSMLVERRNLAADRVLLRAFANADLDDAYVLELHALVGETHVALRADEEDTSTEARLLETLSRIAPRKLSSDAGRGFCLPGISVETDHDFEEARVVYRDSRLRHGDVRISFNVNTFEPPADEASLIQRGEQNLVGLGARPVTLKKGSVTLAGEPGEEWLGRFDEEGVRQHGFFAETQGRSPTRERPRLHVEMTTGGQKLDGDYIKSSLDDTQAIVLWDDTLGSLRSRQK